MKSFTLNRVLFSAGALLLGIILLIWPSNSLYFLARFIGVFLAVGGVAAGVMYFQDHDSALKSILLVMALVMLICGAVIFLHPEELIKLIPTILGIMIVISGLINLGETFILSRSKYGRWWISLIIAVITIGCGIFIINKAFGLAALITRIAGGVLVFDGASHLWVTSRVYKSSKNTATTVEGSAVEVEPKAEGAAAAGTVGGGTASAAAGAQAQGTGATNAAGTLRKDSDSVKAETVQGTTDPAISAKPEAAESGKENHVPAYTHSAKGQSDTEEQDDIPAYMRQVEQETDFLLYSSRNSNDGDNTGTGKAGQ
ncbi:MAG: DUF308 domain-containing protein [Lachnospiraceae bacterium]|nr:DUF308 domain-containing protein [Lachnospiraceae bacterium]